MTEAREANNIEDEALTSTAAPTTGTESTPILTDTSAEAPAIPAAPVRLSLQQYMERKAAQAASAAEAQTLKKAQEEAAEAESKLMGAEAPPTEPGPLQHEDKSAMEVNDEKDSLPYNTIEDVETGTTNSLVPPHSPAVDAAIALDEAPSLSEEQMLSVSPELPPPTRPANANSPISTAEGESAPESGFAAVQSRSRGPLSIPVESDTASMPRFEAPVKVHFASGGRGVLQSGMVTLQATSSSRSASYQALSGHPSLARSSVSAYTSISTSDVARDSRQSDPHPPRRRSRNYSPQETDSRRSAHSRRSPSRSRENLPYNSSRPSDHSKRRRDDRSLSPPRRSFDDSRSRSSASYDTLQRASPSFRERSNDRNDRRASQVPSRGDPRSMSRWQHDGEQDDDRRSARRGWEDPSARSSSATSGSAGYVVRFKQEERFGADVFESNGLRQSSSWWEESYVREVIGDVFSEVLQSM